MRGTYQVCAVILPVLFSTFTAGCESVPTGANNRAILAPTVMLPPDEPLGTREYVINPSPIYDPPGESLFAVDSRRDGNRFLSAAPELDLSTTENPENGSYGFGSFGRHTASIPWDLLGISATLATIGVTGSGGTSSFRTNSEGFFGKDTSNGGMDKLGHAFATYAMADYLSYRIGEETGHQKGAEISGAALSFMIMGGVEIFDGFSSTYGFSYEDIIMNTIGAVFSYTRNTVPGLRDKLDFRLEYIPSGNADDSRNDLDYSGQKYLLALKLAGFDVFRDTPLRFIEIHGGYFARGFTEAERSRLEPLRREPYVGIGLNLQELVFGAPWIRDAWPSRIGRRILEYVQIPYTYYATSMD